MGRFSRRQSRAAQALLCVAVVLLAHAVLWRAWTVATAPPTRTPSVQVRRVPAEGVVAQPAETIRSPAPTVASADPQPPRRRVTPATTPKAAARAASLPVAAASSPEPEPAAPAHSESVSAAAPTPVYPTRIPPSTQLHFTLQRGSTVGEATLTWRVDGERYVLQLHASIAPGRPLERQSQGGFDEAGLAPVRMADRRNGRDLRAANFQREQRKISFSGPRWEWPLHPGAQDRVSWLVQLVAIAEAAPDALRDGGELSMWVVGTRGALSAWRFDVRGRQDLMAPGGVASAWWLVREPEHPYDLRIEVWLDPARGHWPLRLRQTQVPGGEPLEWTLRDEPQLPGGS